MGSSSSTGSGAQSSRSTCPIARISAAQRRTPVYRLRRSHAHRHIDAHQRFHPEIRRSYPFYRDVHEAPSDRHGRRGDQHDMILPIIDHDRLGHRQQPENSGAPLAAKEAPDRAHALEAILVLSIDDGDKPLGDIVKVADKRDTLHERVDQTAHATLEPGFDRDPEQVNQSDHNNSSKRIGGDGGVRKVEADRYQHAADRAVRTEIDVNERADPSDHGKRYRQWQQDQESGDKGSKAADHWSPSVMGVPEETNNRRQTRSRE